jgi:MoaA/NifB/PqqE/SkfB family radical SAM enzyme
MIEIERSYERTLLGILPVFTKKLKIFWHKIKFYSQSKSIAKEIKNDVEEFFKSENSLPLFNYIEIETLNKCNGTCSFCPVNRNLDPRPLAKMSEDTFRKIIDNLAKLNYSGTVAYYSNNEPLMDNRIIEFIKYGVSKIPNAQHNLFSNGTLLTEEKFQALIDCGLNYLLIDNYNDKLKMNPNIQKIYDKYVKEKFSMNCKIDLRFNNQTLSNRGGTSPNKHKSPKTLTVSCWHPFIQLIIRADSGVSLCCMDALGKVTLGNVDEQTLEEIWFGEKHINILKSIRKNLRNDINICKECDYIASKSRYLWVC